MLVRLPALLASRAGSSWEINVRYPKLAYRELIGNQASKVAGRLKPLLVQAHCAILKLEHLKSEHLKSAKSMSHLKLRFRTASEMQSSTGCEFRTAGFDSL